MPNTKCMLSKWPKLFKSVPNERNFAQSGHTGAKVDHDLMSKTQ